MVNWLNVPDLVLIIVGMVVEKYGEREDETTTRTYLMRMILSHFIDGIVNVLIYIYFNGKGIIATRNW
jgi:hypothetical protein